MNIEGEAQKKLPLIVCSSSTTILRQPMMWQNNYSYEDGFKFNKEKVALIEYSKNKKETNYIIPDSVTSIGDVPFYECESLTAVTFLGDAPKAGNEVFGEAAPTIYRKPDAKGWGDTWGGRPVKLISEKP